MSPRDGGWDTPGIAADGWTAGWTFEQDRGATGSNGPGGPVFAGIGVQSHRELGTSLGSCLGTRVLRKTNVDRLSVHLPLITKRDNQQSTSWTTLSRQRTAQPRMPTDSWWTVW